MKKLFLIVFSVISFSFFNGINSRALNQTPPAVNIVQVSNDIEFVEYVLIGEQWYMITYYTDGSIGIEPVNNPPQE